MTRLVSRRAQRAPRSAALQAPLSCVQARLPRGRVASVVLGALLVLSLLAAPDAQAQRRTAVDLDEVDWSAIPTEVEAFPGIPLFTMPFVNAQMDFVKSATRRRDYTTAMRMLDNLIARYPLVADFHATQAALLTATGAVEEALSALDTALDLGFDEVGTLRNAPAFKELSANAGFRDITARRRKPLPIQPRKVVAARVDGQTAMVDHGNTIWTDSLGRLVSRFNFPDTLAARAPFADAARGTLKGRLTERIRAGEAAGLAGVLYDNRDRDHVTLLREHFPQLSFVEYNRAAKAAQLDYGLNLGLLFNGVVIGNSSTARTGRFWRSQPRVALTQPFGPEGLALLYLADHFYLFPEHRDHDPVSEGGKGDVFPANTPFYMVSQGSSGSEYRLLEGALYALAAMTPQTRDYLNRRNITAPTLQMILRRAMAPVADDPERYLTGIAHPSAFDAAALDFETVVAIAERLRPETVPPVPILRTLSDFSGQPGVDYFGDGESERLFDSGFSIGRIWRSTKAERSMLLVAGPNFETGEGVIRMRWSLLRGDPERVTIRELDPRGLRAEITVDWHERGTVPGRDDLTTDRVDIGVFADNGLEISAPAFISILKPAGQAREYEPDGQGGQRIARVDYSAGAEDETIYDDPLIFAAKPWEDRYDYTEDGTLIGWTRQYADGRRERYTSTGQLVRESDASGRPTLVEAVAYPIRRLGDGARLIRVEPTGRLFDYVYPNDTDLAGVLVPRELAGSEGRDEGGVAD
ncbi:MAG: hypothetical protein AAF371_18030 [Pseudomonadota bacterium]